MCDYICVSTSGLEFAHVCVCVYIYGSQPCKLKKRVPGSSEEEGGREEEEEEEEGEESKNATRPGPGSLIPVIFRLTLSPAVLTSLWRNSKERWI